MAKIQCNVISYTLLRTVDIEVILPSITIPESMRRMKGQDIHHDYSHKYPVLYLLHGFGNNYCQWNGYTNIELYAEERQIAVVLLSAENKNYLNTEQDKFEDFIENELQEFITEIFPISKRKEDAYIAGLSMGGFGALYHGLKYNDKYQAIGAFSPAIKMDTISVDLFKMVEETKVNNKIFITCGENDFLYDLNIKFIDKLKENKINYTWISEANYKHEWRFWDLSVERFLDWIDRSDAYANKKRSV
ncbi:MAG: hypothetical protein LUH02_01165 [Erysipelotrichaceae bacterium]|nr:hypothetical protein [Erysipelotrichaceae bacterium]